MSAITRVGDLVTAEMHVVCNQCFQCRTGNAHLCENVVILGVDGDGCFADYIAVPESNLWRVPKGIDPEWAAIYDPFGNAVHTVMAGATVGKSFLILGGGPIGIAAIPVCKAAGASLVLVSEVHALPPGAGQENGRRPRHRPGQGERGEVVRSLTAGQGVDVVLEMSGHPAAIAQGFRSIRKNGRYSLLGIPAKPVSHRPGQGHHFPRRDRPGHQRPAHVRDLVPDGRPAGLGQGRPEAADHPPLQDGRFQAKAFEIGLSGNAGKIILE